MLIHGILTSEVAKAQCAQGTIGRVPKLLLIQPDTEVEILRRVPFLRSKAQCPGGSVQCVE